MNHFEADVKVPSSQQKISAVAGSGGSSFEVGDADLGRLVEVGVRNVLWKEGSWRVGCVKEGAESCSSSVGLREALLLPFLRRRRLPHRRQRTRHQALLGAAEMPSAAERASSLARLSAVHRRMKNRPGWRFCLGTF